jgi:hypothetical protein
MDEVDLLQRAIKLLSKHQRRAAASCSQVERKRNLKIPRIHDQVHYWSIGHLR